jgi:competence protein ComEA
MKIVTVGNETIRSATTKKIALGLVGLILPILSFAGPVNINKADAESLAQELIGIGISKAEAIVEYRNQNGAFELPEELLKVKGIGPRVLAANRDYILITE